MEIKIIPSETELTDGTANLWIVLLEIDFTFRNICQYFHFVIITINYLTPSIPPHSNRSLLVIYWSDGTTIWSAGYSSFDSKSFTATELPIDYIEII